MNNPINTPKSAFQEAETPLTPESEKVITAKVKSHVLLDGVAQKIGATVKISVQQWRALSRHFEYLDGPKEHHPETYHPRAQSVL